jgi:hypothetical protein
MDAGHDAAQVGEGEEQEQRAEQRQEGPPVALHGLADLRL